MTAPRVCVFRHPNLLMVSHVRNLLVSAGIEAELGNVTLSGGAGELPLDQCEAEVWVERADAENAKALVKSGLEGPQSPPPAWRCTNCGEWLEGVFDTCWQCGEARQMPSGG